MPKKSEIIDVEVISSTVEAEQPEEQTTAIAKKRVYAPPANFDGTPEEFNLLTGALEPRHCAFPDGQRLDPRTGLPCRRKKEKHGCCALHAQSQLPQVVNSISPALRDRMASFLADFNSALPKTNVAISEMVLYERMAMLDSGESASFMEMIDNVVERGSSLLTNLVKEIEKDLPDLMTKQLADQLYEGDEEGSSEEHTDWPAVVQQIKAIRNALQSLHRAAEIRKRKHDALDALEKANLASVKVKESASRMDQDRERVISKQHATQMSMEVIDIYLQALEKFIKDDNLKREMLNFVHDAADRLLGKLG